jgi:transcriptional regulator with XRE-family HTH domain
MENSIGLKILVALRETKMTQYELAEKLATSHSLVSKWVNDIVVPNKTSMEKLAETLHKPVQYFTQGSIYTGIIPEYDDFEPLSCLREEKVEYKTWELIYNESTDGNTRASLAMLRDVLVKLFRSKICAVELEIEGAAMVPMNGFLVIDMNEKKTYWSGDGFGHHHMGTGHRGYDSAHGLLLALGVGINYWPSKITLSDNDGDRTEFKKTLLEIANEVFNKHKDWFGVPITKWPIF